MQRRNDCAVRERELPLAKGLYRNVVAQLSAQLPEATSCEVADSDQAPVAVSSRNCDAIDRGGITPRLYLALLGALCGGFREVESANEESGANAQSTMSLRSDVKCHDLLLASGRLNALPSCAKRDQ